MSEHYITAIAVTQSYASVLACRCGWLLLATSPSQVRDGWDSHLIDPVEGTEVR